MSFLQSTQVHIFDLFDVIALMPVEQRRIAFDKIVPGFYEEFTKLRNDINGKKIAETPEVMQRFKDLKSTLDASVEIAVQKEYLNPTLNPELIEGLTVAYNRGIQTVIYSTGKKESMWPIIQGFGIDGLIDGYVSPHILASAGPNEARKLPQHFREIAERVQSGIVAGIVKRPGSVVFMVDDKAPYSACAAALGIGISGYVYNPKANDTYVVEEDISNIRDVVGPVKTLKPNVIVVPSLRDIYVCEGLLK